MVAWQPNVAAPQSQMGEEVVSWSAQNEQPTLCLTLAMREWAERNADVLDRFLSEEVFDFTPVCLQRCPAR